jgi:hypothetical protein
MTTPMPPGTPVDLNMGNVPGTDIPFALEGTISEWVEGGWYLVRTDTGLWEAPPEFVTARPD